MGEFDPHCTYKIGILEKSVAHHGGLFANTEVCDAQEKGDRMHYRKRFVKKHIK